MILSPRVSLPQNMEDGEKWGEGREEKERGCASRVECDEREKGVEKPVEVDPSAWEKSPIASSLSSSIGTCQVTWSVCEDVDSSENRGCSRSSVSRVKLANFTTRT